jgi:HEAT repeat protein
MSPFAIALFLAVLAAGTGVPPQGSKAPGPAGELASEENHIKQAGLPVTDTGLLDFFRKRTPPGPPRAEVARLVRQLSDKAPAARDRAAAELIALGYCAVPPLRQAANSSDDEEGLGRARHCLDCIEGPHATALAVAEARLVAARRPAGAAAVLVAYLPFADNDEVLQEAESALLAVGMRDGKAEDALLKALEDPVPVRRSVAARVLCQAGGPAERAAVRALLRDQRPSVRLQAAMGLAAANEGQAVTVLIDMLPDLPPAGCKEAEEFLTELAGTWAVVTPQGSDRLSARVRREAWAAWWRATDGPALLEELRRRTLTDEERQRLATWIAQLEDGSAAVRDKAAASLVDWGPRAAGLLRRAAREANPRVAPLVAQCLESLEEGGATPPPLPAAVPRLLALHRPPGAVEALLQYLPFADGETPTDQLVDLLASLGCPEGKAAPALVQALADRTPERRAAAACALARGRAAEHLGAVRKLLRDPDAAVRTRTALALAQGGDRDAVDVLISLLGELPGEQVGDVVEYLTSLAGDSTPRAYVETEPAARAATVAAWKAWWRQKGPGIDPGGDAVRRPSGALLVIEHHGPRGTGRVLEVSVTGKIRWQMEGITFPWDAQRLANGNLLLADQGNRVCERDREGKVVWQVSVPNAIGCQRLANGHTFVLTRNSVQVVDRQGKEVLTHYHTTGWILGGRRFRDGHMAFVTYQGQYVRLDPTGKEVKTFHVPFNANFGVLGAEVLPGDRVIVSLPNPGKVLEYNAEGKVVWEASVRNPGCPTRLRNGHTLVPGNGYTTLTELDRSGRVISEKKDLPYRPFRVYPR